MSLRSRSQRAAVRKAIDYVEWSSSSGDEYSSEPEDDENGPALHASHPAPAGAETGQGPMMIPGGEEGMWMLRLTVTDDEERHYELVGEALDSPLPPLIKPPKKVDPPAPATSLPSSSPQTQDARPEADGGSMRSPEETPTGKARKESFYAAMKRLEGGQNVGFLEGWWFCLRASGSEEPKAVSLAASRPVDVAMMTTTTTTTTTTPSAAPRVSSPLRALSSSSLQPQPLMLSAGRKKLARFPTEGLLSCYLTYGPPNAPQSKRQVSYSLQDISYDVQQSFLSTVGDRKQRQKSGKTYHVDRSVSPTCETDQLVLRIENGKLVAVRLFVELKDLPESWRKRVQAEQRYRETHQVLFRKQEGSKRVQFDDDRVSVRLYLCNDPPTQHLAEKTQIISEEENGEGKRKLKEKGEGAILKTALKTRLADEEEEEGGVVHKETGNNDSASPMPEQQQVPLPKLDEQELAKKTVIQLRAMLKERNQPVTGNKETLMGRLTGKTIFSSKKTTAPTETVFETDEAKGKTSNKRKRKKEKKVQHKLERTGSSESGMKKVKTKRESGEGAKPSQLESGIDLSSDLSAMPRDRLRQLAARLKIIQRGSKEELIARLKQFGDQIDGTVGNGTCTSEEIKLDIKPSPIHQPAEEIHDVQIGDQAARVAKEQQNEKKTKEDSIPEGKKSGEGAVKTAPAPTPDRKEQLLQAKTILELRQLCKEKGVRVSGHKEELVVRLLTHIVSVPETAPTTSRSPQASRTGKRKVIKTPDTDGTSITAMDSEQQTKTNPTKRLKSPPRPRTTEHKREGTMNEEKNCGQGDKAVDGNATRAPPKGAHTATPQRPAALEPPRVNMTSNAAPTVKRGPRRVGLSRKRPTKPLHPAAQQANKAT